MARKTKPRQKVKSERAAHARKDVASFRESLWKTLDRNSAGLSGRDVIKALKVISDDVYHAGIDEAYTQTSVRDSRNLADAWDLTWVTALSVDLRRRQEAAGHARRRPTPRKKRIIRA